MYTCLAGFTRQSDQIIRRRGTLIVVDILWDINTTVTFDPKKCVISHGRIKGAPSYVLFATTGAHVILRWESCSQTFPTVVAHGQTSEEGVIP